MLFAPIGEEGQRRLLAARVLIIGCGALGSHLADTLIRAGVGFLRIVDRDIVELNNLQRQILFDENDVATRLPKVEAAKRKLNCINSTVSVEPIVVDVDHRNIEPLADGIDLLLDGTDNFQTRYLINDLAVATNRPWIFGACAGATGMSLPIVPGITPCLRCIFEEAPPHESTATANTHGILGAVVSMVAAHQAIEAIKILTGHREALERRLLQFDAWNNRMVHIDVSSTKSTDCPCCGQKRFDFLISAK
ncbi:MAG: ThiF family adenylyltransferase [Phycisphaerae bacterium]|nr:ThiF family adenylyltransferase [Phycisphaerae bacterium]